MAQSPTEQVRELVLELKVLTERDENRRRELERVAVKAEATQAEVAVLRQENAVLRQQHQDHIKQTELQDSRRWGLFIALAGVLLGAVLSLASGLIVTLARK